MIEGCFVTALFYVIQKNWYTDFKLQILVKQLFENRGPMKTTKSFGEYPQYSLHDARVQKIEYVDDSLIFTFDYIFSYENGVEQTHKAQVVFETCDIDDLEILVFNSTILDTFTGKRIELPQYQQDYSESEFEVITETYNWGRAVFQGWLWTEGNPVHCIMNIYFTGDMVYVVDEA